MNSILEKIEGMLYDEFCRTSFHNLLFQGYQPSYVSDLGGTCTDKVLAFKARLDREGISSRLHCGYIQRDFPHRLLYLKVDGNEYFADVGNGWPSIRLFPANREISYSAYGIRFSTVKQGDFLEIYQFKQGKRTHSLTIPLALREELLEMEEIEHRFDKNTNYPFAQGGLRFAQVVGNRFIFLKNNRIRFFHINGDISEKLLNDDVAVYQAIEKYFSTDLSLYGLHYTAL